MMDILASIPFFQTLEQEERNKVLEHIKIDFFPTGHTIFKEDDEAEAFYIIRSGAVRIFQTKQDFEKTIIVLGPGEFFGEMALISNDARNASAQMLEEGEVFILEKQDLYSLLETHPDIAKKISEVFVQRSKEQ